MRNLTKVHPPDKEVLKDVTLAFYPGAKIGVLGANGSGKSTLLRIMAGVDTEVRGEADLADGASVGLLEQEPELDETKDVRGNVEDGVTGHEGPDRPLQRAGRQLLRGDRGRVRQAPGEDRRRGRVEPGHHAGHGHGRPALPARRRGREQALRRRAPPRGAVPAAAEPARPAAAGRAHQPPGRRVGGLAGAPPGRVPGRRGGRDPRPLLPGQRGRLDPGAGPRPRAAVRGQLLVLAGAEGQAAGPGGEEGELAPAHPGRRAGVGAHERVGAPDQEQGPAGPLRRAPGRGAQRQGRQRRDPHPRRPAPGRRGGRGRERVQGLRRPAADREPELQAAAGRHRGHHRRQRRRQDHAAAHDHRRGAARQRRAAGGGDRGAGLRGPVPRRPGLRRSRCGRRSPAAPTSSRSATAR